MASPNSSAWLYWRENLHRSIYRVFLIGAALCRKYQEPLSPAEGSPQPPYFLDDIIHDDSIWYTGPTWDPDHDDFKCLLKYPIFNLGAYEQHEPIYGPLADFLLQQSRKRAHDQRDILPEDLVYHEESLCPDYIEIKEHASLIFADTLESLFAFMAMAGYAHWTIIKGETPKDDIGTDSEAESNPRVGIFTRRLMSSYRRVG